MFGVHPVFTWLTTMGVTKLGRPHLYEIDLMRSCVILGVVCVHLTSYFSQFAQPLSGSRTALDMSLVVLHYTREVFMFITGLVLFYTYYDRPHPPVLSFWQKRFKLIVIPYLAWNMIYVLFEGTYIRHFAWSVADVWTMFWMGVVKGNLFFLYYLLVTMQFYIVFPLLWKLLKRFEQQQIPIVVASFVLQLLLMATEEYLVPRWQSSPALPTWVHVFLGYEDSFVLSYQFWFIAGAIAAVHYTAVKAWLRTHTRVVRWVLVCAILGAWSWFVIARWGLHQSEADLITVLQPVMVPYSLIVGGAFLTLGIIWSERRAGVPVWTKLIQFFGGASFGIFLIHPLALHFVEQLGYRWYFPMPLHLFELPLSIAAVYVSSGIVAHWVGKVPVLSYIVGKKV